MLSRLIIATLLFALIRASICVELKGYSAFAEDLTTPLSNATSLSPNWPHNIFARQGGSTTCTAGSPFVSCPTPKKCCSASDNWHVHDLCLILANDGAVCPMAVAPRHQRRAAAGFVGRRGRCVVATRGAEQDRFVNGHLVDKMCAALLVTM